MKIEAVRHVTDKNELYNIFNSLFMNREVMLKAQGMNIKVDMIKIEEGKIFIRIPDADYRTQASAIFTRHDQEIYFSHVVPNGTDGDLFIFEPEGIQVFTAPRKEVRKTIDGNSVRRAVIKGIVSAFVVDEAFKNNRSRVEWLRSEIHGKFDGRFEYTKIFFMNDRKSDTRMKWILQERKPVFIPAIKTRQVGTDSDEYGRYMNDIYYSDPLLKDGIFNSEIIVPLLYRGMMPFGYIQINHTEILPEDALSYAKRIGMAFSESVSKDPLLFKPSDDSMMITDLSLNGLGIVFKERSLIRHFREDESIVFTVIMPENRQAIMMSRIMNINHINNIYRIGCMIKDIDPIGDANYQEFLGML